MKYFLWEQTLLCRMASFCRFHPKVDPTVPNACYLWHLLGFISGQQKINLSRPTVDYILKGDGVKCICDVTFLHSAQIKTEDSRIQLILHAQNHLRDSRRQPAQVPVIEPQVSDYSVRLVCNYIIIIILCMEEYASLNSLNTKKW